MTPSSSAVREMLPDARSQRLANRLRLGVLPHEAQIQARRRRGHGQTEVRGRHELAFRHDHRGLDLVLHLADVAGPRVRLDRVLTVVRESLDHSPVLRRRTCSAGVARAAIRPPLALAQRRNVNRDLADSVVEVVAERAARHRLPASSCSSRRRRARRPESPCGRRCARTCAPGGNAAAWPAAATACRRSRRGTTCRRPRPRSCPCVCFTAPVNAPFSKPNSSDSSSVSGIAAQLIATNGLSARVAQRVDRAREHFLARAALAQQQRRRVRRRDLLDRAADLEHRLARGDHAVERRSAERGDEPPILGLERVDLVRALHDELQRVDVDRLLVEVVGAEAHGFHGVALVAMARDHDDLRERRERENLAQRRETFGHALVVRRQTEILQHDGRLVPAQLVDRAASGPWPR